MSAPEFSRTRRLDQIGAGAVTVEVAATPQERAALARRFGLRDITRLEARFAVRQVGEAVRADGHVSADIVQACVVTDAPVPGTIDEDVSLRFVPPPGDDDAEEIELSGDECDTMFLEGGSVDLGEAAAETMALALDPYPRAPEAPNVLREAGVLSEEEAGPFGALAGLRDKLEKK